MLIKFNQSWSSLFDFIKSTDLLKDSLFLRTYSATELSRYDQCWKEGPRKGPAPAHFFPLKGPGGGVFCH